MATLESFMLAVTPSNPVPITYKHLTSVWYILCFGLYKV